MRRRVLNALCRSVLPHRSGKSAMRDFSHLSVQAAAPPDSAIADTSPERRHSDAHRIAVSLEGRNNPVMALALIEKRVSSDKAINTLATSPRQLSRFTKRKMRDCCPGWELMDAESQNMAAFSTSMASNDANGYLASMKAAGQALEKYVEPITTWDLVALASQVTVTKFN